MFRPALIFLLLRCGGAVHAHPEIEDALVRLQGQIAASPADATLYRQRGELYARHEQWILAEANYLRAAELSPQLPRLDILRAALELATGRAAAACPRLDAALRLDPADVEALILRARVHVALKRSEQAVADFNAVLRLLPAPAPELYLERAALLPPAAALRSLADGIERLGPVVTLQLRALALEESLGRIDAAAARLDRLAAESDRREVWLKRRGDLLARAGRSAEAQDAYRAALAAIDSLPDWLRQSSDTAALATRLRELIRSRS